ncbi:pirin family protein [Brevibacterium daeguense]|uniref:Pirin family protein n=1 Tax=Brevibacterium daeguense TaxID=909936 RepID=A0ABP8EJ74_9MICO|nr:pirin family protein [Brevibacterium daeguense]
MTNPEIDPAEYECSQVTCAHAVDIITARDVPLGGPRAMTVRRTLPQRKRSLIGPWCFLDHYGPDDVTATGGMQVPRHPHTGLATVTLLFEGRVEHIDSTGFANIVRPSEVNLMIAGSGISHSEFSTADTDSLHGVQLWYVLPEDRRNGAPGSQHHVARPTAVPGGTVLTYLGQLAGTASPVDTRVEAMAGQLIVDPGQTMLLDVDPRFEHGALLDSGTLTVHVDGHEQSVGKDELAYLPPGPSRIGFQAGNAPTRVVFFGGAPFEERVVMWWNFVGRSHDEIVAYRAAWQAEIGAEAPAGPADQLAGPAGASPAGTSGAGEPAGAPSAARAADAGVYFDGVRAPRFGDFPVNQPAPLPAPRLPNVRIKPRMNP